MELDIVPQYKLSKNFSSELEHIKQKHNPDNSSDESTYWGAVNKLVILFNNAYIQSKSSDKSKIIEINRDAIVKSAPFYESIARNMVTDNWFGEMDLVFLLDNDARRSKTLRKLADKNRNSYVVIAGRNYYDSIKTKPYFYKKLSINVLIDDKLRTFNESEKKLYDFVIAQLSTLLIEFIVQVDPDIYIKMWQSDVLHKFALDIKNYVSNNAPHIRYSNIQSILQDVIIPSLTNATPIKMIIDTESENRIKLLKSSTIDDLKKLIEEIPKDRFLQQIEKRTISADNDSIPTTESVIEQHKSNPMNDLTKISKTETFNANPKITVGLAEPNNPAVNTPVIEQLLSKPNESQLKPKVDANPRQLKLSQNKEIYENIIFQPKLSNLDTLSYLFGIVAVIVILGILVGIAFFIKYLIDLSNPKNKKQQIAQVVKTEVAREQN